MIAWLVVLSRVAAALTAVSRRQVGCGLVAGTLFNNNDRASAAAEWRCALPEDWAIQKRQESSVRIRAETMLVASSSSQEVKLLKIPLGRSAATSFEPEEQIELSRYFASRQSGVEPKRVADIFASSLQRQAANPASPLLAATVDLDSATVSSRQAKRYLSLDYATDGCRKLDEDGACVGRSSKVATAVLTVSLESQARTQEEQRRMDRGDLEVSWLGSSSLILLCVGALRRHALALHGHGTPRWRRRRPPAKGTIQPLRRRTPPSVRSLCCALTWTSRSGSGKSRLPSKSSTNLNSPRRPPPFIRISCYRRQKAALYIILE